MKLIINTSNIVVGGGIQVSLSILEELKKKTENMYYVFLSKAVERELNVKNFADNFTFYTIEHSPAGLKKGFKVRRLLSKLEKEINPDLVFTVFGPAYWTPKSIHISGFADGWCYNPNSLAFSQLPFDRKVRNKLLVARKNFFIKKSDYIIVETDVAKANVIKYLKIESEKIFVVGNTYHPVFTESSEIGSEKAELEKDTFVLLVLSSFYPHKNLQIINKVISCLKVKSNKKYKFLLTLKQDDFERNFSKSVYLENLGVQSIEDCPKLYKRSDVLFLPTLLETFTATYPEAMIMQRPILTSNLDFANDICGDAALYFEPLNPEDIADKIIQLSHSKELYNELVIKGNKMILEFETSESRVEKYLSIFNGVIN